MKKHGPNTARKFNHDGYSCKNTVLIVTAMGKTEKTRSKWATMGGMSNMVLIVTARLQLSSVEYSFQSVEIQRLIFGFRVRQDFFYINLLDPSGGL